MQIVGRSCHGCGEKLSSVLDAEGCEACDVAFHTACLVEGISCSECGQDISEAREESAARAQLEVQTALKKGRRWTMLIIGALVISSLLSLATRLLVPIDDMRIMTAVVRFGLTLALIYFLYRGHRWARIVTTLLCSIALVVAWVGAYAIAAIPGSLLAAAPLFAMGAAMGAVAVTLTVSSSIRTFLHVQRFPGAMADRYGHT